MENVIDTRDAVMVEVSLTRSTAALATTLAENVRGYGVAEGVFSCMHCQRVFSEKSTI